MLRTEQEIRAQILTLVKEYYGAAFEDREEIPGKDTVRIGGRVFGASELVNLVDASLDFWLTDGGRFSTSFTEQFSQLLNRKYSVLTNSGSSANLLAISALCSHNLEDRKLQPGDEIITVAAAFPTTVNPILQNGLIPVFVDIDLETYNINIEQMRAGLSSRTRAIFLAHTLGNPFDLGKVMAFAKEHDLFVIEDACDALDSKYKGKPVGTFGDMATFSFYPAHHITMGEGGAVVTDSEPLKRALCSIRNWGRDCFCPPGKDNVCKKRFDRQMGDLPYGYDHKYTITHIGYNLKLLDIQAAIGLAQLERLGDFTTVRRRNFDYIMENLKCYEHFFYMPEATAGSEPSWFGFLLTMRPDAPFNRNAIIRFLEAEKIMTRMLFSGNILKHPAYQDVPHRIVSTLKNTDYTMENSFWVGLYPGLNQPMLDFLINAFHQFLKRF